MVQRAEDDRNNFDHGNIFHKTHDQIKVVDDIIEIHFYCDSEYDEDGDYIPIPI